MGLGERLKIKRMEKNMTLEELGKKTNVSRATIQRYESGVISNIPSDKIELLADALEVSPAYLMGWEDEKEPEYEIQTIAAHHDGEDWTEEELEEIERFKAFVKSKRGQK